MNAMTDGLLLNKKLIGNMKPEIKTIGQCLDRVLEDDDKCNGGTAFVGETLRDFLLSVNMGTLKDVIMDAKVSSLDKLLTDNGIMPIR